LTSSYLARALALAERGRYSVSPNPMVGAVIVAGRRVVGEGFHRRAGGPHAEVIALKCAGSLARGADLYLTLEPCVHFGRTPPCVPAIIQSGLRRVVVAARDPNPEVARRGLPALRRAGIEVVMADAEYRKRAERQNEKFRTWITERRPFVLAKWAATLDGKTATAAGESQWISGPESRRRALRLREEYDGVLVGAGTVLADDPLLTRRLGLNRVTPHWRIVLDGRLQIPEKPRLFRRPENVIVATALSVNHSKARSLAGRGVAVWSLPSGVPGRVSLRKLMKRLALEEVTSLIVEGGAETLGGFFRANLVDRVAVFTAPRILGGAQAPGGVGGPGFPLRQARRITEVECEALGDDWLITGRMERRSTSRP